MSENVTFGIKINVDDKGVGQATINVKELANVVNKVKESASKNPFKEWKKSIFEFEALTNALSRYNLHNHKKKRSPYPTSLFFNYSILQSFTCPAAEHSGTRFAECSCRQGG